MFKLLSLFSGVGAFEKAFEYLNLEYELVNYCEIDKYASKSYALIHHVPESMNLGDITKVDTSKLPRDIDLITYGFPCQDISAAGKLRGFVDESGNVTRSGLFFEALRIIEDTKPKIAIAENVKNLVSKKFKTEFTAVLNSLNEAGYNCYWQVLNAKDYGIPQNRERVFIVSIRKDIDNRTFTFPKPFELSIRLRDVLEDEVDEKYYISKKMAIYIAADNETLKNKTIVEPNLKTKLCNKLVKEGLVKEGDVIRHSYSSNRLENGDKNLGRVENHEGLSPTLDTRCDCLGVVVKDKNNNELALYKDTKLLRETIENASLEEGEPKALDLYNRSTRENVAQTLDSGYHNTQRLFDGLRIRKLTPKECFRLMGFKDYDIDTLLNSGVSNTQLYKQAGNSIVINVIEQILAALFELPLETFTKQVSVFED